MVLRSYPAAVAAGEMFTEQQLGFVRTTRRSSVPVVVGGIDDNLRVRGLAPLNVPETSPNVVVSQGTKLFVVPPRGSADLSLLIRTLKKADGFAELARQLETGSAEAYIPGLLLICGQPEETAGTPFRWIRETARWMYFGDEETSTDELRVRFLGPESLGEALLQRCVDFDLTIPQRSIAALQQEAQEASVGRHFE